MIEIKKIVQELRDKLMEYEDFEGLYLYGSYAKGTQSDESDIDIAGIFKKDHNYDFELNSKIYDFDLKYDVFNRFSLCNTWLLKKKLYLSKWDKKRCLLCQMRIKKDQENLGVALDFVQIFFYVGFE